jgi:type IV secretion system protein VirD4
MLTMGILYAHYTPELSSSPEGVLDFFSSPGESIPSMLTRMAGMENRTLQRSAARLKKMSVTQVRDSWSAAVEWLTTWDDPILARHTNRTTIPWWRLQHGKHPMTIYFRLHPMDARGRLRSFFWLLLEQMTTYLAQRPGRRDRRVLYDIFDDMAEFGRLPIAADIASYRRKDRIYLMGSFQTPTQWWHAAGKYDGLFGSCGVWVIYRQNEPDAAAYLSKKLGERTVIERTMQVSQSGLVGTSRQSRGYRAHGRQLLDPGELMSLDPDEVVVCVLRHKVKAQRLNVYTDRRFKNRLQNGTKG